MTSKGLCMILGAVLTLLMSSKSRCMILGAALTLLMAIPFCMAIAKAMP